MHPLLFRYGRHHNEYFWHGRWSVSSPATTVPTHTDQMVMPVYRLNTRRPDHAFLQGYSHRLSIIKSVNKAFVLCISASQLCVEPCIATKCLTMPMIRLTFLWYKCFHLCHILIFSLWWQVLMDEPKFSSKENLGLYIIQPHIDYNF